MARPRGLFIAIEGVDAVGKRTQTSLLRDWLRENAKSTYALSFPAYETAIGKEIRRFLDGRVEYPPQVRAMLYAANRWEKKPELDEAIANTDVLIVDRYSGSNFAYGVSGGLKLDWLTSLEDGLPMPDLTMLLDAPLAKLVPRRGTKDSYERNTNLQERAREAYLELAAKFGWTVVDANRGVQEIAGTVRSAVTNAFGVSGRTI
ncbi:MAG: dTMP kinase [Nitrososphaerota archaeon]|nr:dTMP kinase [Nitrososphaerota archaeon]